MSIHDVMPQTLPQCRQILELLFASRIKRVTLLVVPGCDWSPEDIDELRDFTRQGATLAGHGWNHRARHILGVTHRLHSALISRDVAEHLALDSEEIVELVNRSHDWFTRHDLPVSDLYVPPAWALGRVSRQALAETPYRLFETLGGVVDVGAERFRPSPMVGFEADTGFRALGCRIWNWANLLYAGNTRPIRVAIHPNDLSLRLADDLRALIERGGNAMSYNILKAPH